MFGVTLPARVVGVTDGDTIEVEVSRRLRIRLLDCWAPETRTTDPEEKQRGFAAKEFLHDLIHGKDVSVQIDIEPDERFGDQMSFGRVLARVYLDGMDVSKAVVEAGHATSERG